MKNKITVPVLQSKKEANQSITMLTAYDYPIAKLLDESGIDIAFVGDSVGNVVLGYPDTLQVTLEEMIHHSKAVSRAVQHSMVLVDLPFLSYQISEEQAKTSAGRLVKEGGAEAVKVEVNPHQLDYVDAIIKMGIPVMGHIGFTPQSVHQLGGYKVQGKTEEDAKQLLELAMQLEEMGCFSILLEMVPTEVSKAIQLACKVPVIGIGAGPYCDGQVLVTHDLLGFSGSFSPRFVKQYAQLGQDISDAFRAFKLDVESGDFPKEEHGYS